MKDPLIAWLKEDPMNATIFREYDAALPGWAKLIYWMRAYLGV